MTILFVFVYAFYYETSGQVDFFAGPLILLILSLVYFLVLLRLKLSPGHHPAVPAKSLGV